MEALEVIGGLKELDSETRLIDVVREYGCGLTSSVVSPTQILFNMQGTIYGGGPTKE
jgi:hypothetical protein